MRKLADMKYISYLCNKKKKQQTKNKNHYGAEQQNLLQD